MTLAGEVLGAGGETAFGHTAETRRAVAGDELRVLPVRTDADIRAVAVGENVQARAKVEIDAEPAELARLDQALLVRKALFAGRADGEIVGKDRDAATEHHDATALVIGGDEQASPQRFLQTSQQIEQLP